MVGEPLTQPAGPVTIEVIGARGLRNADWMIGQGKSDCYCTCTIDGQQKLRTPIVKDSLDPVWEYEAELKERQPGQHLDLAVFDKDLGMNSDFLGKARLLASHFEREGFHGELQLEDSGTDGQAFLKVKVKVPGREYPAGPSGEFKVSLQFEEGTETGLELDLSDTTTAVVQAVKPGPFEAHNNAASPLQRLEAGQYIVAVNGDLGESVGAAQLAERLRGGGQLELTVRRAMLFPIAIKKDAGEALGLDLRSEESSAALLISGKITGGPLKRWNLGHQDQLVQVGDRIVAVNGVRGSAAKLQEAINKAVQKESLQLLLSRPARDGWWWWT